MDETKLLKLDGDVLLFAEDEPAFASRWDSDMDPRRELQILPISYVDKYKQNYEFKIKTKIVPGCMFVKHPNKKNLYIDIKDFEDVMLEYRFNSIERIASYLGAKHINSCIETDDENEKQMGVKGAVTYDVVTMSGEYKSREHKKITQYKECEYKLVNSLTCDNYNKALSIAEESGLRNDNDVEKLLEFRNPENQPKYEEYKISYVVSKESNSAKEIAASISAFAGKFSISAEICNCIKERHKMSLFVKIEF